MEQLKNKVKIIKRYQNRKLYDTENHCYVTLEEIFYMVKSGENIQVIDNKHGQDLTYKTLLNIIFDQENKKTKNTKKETLENIIKDYGSFTNMIESQKNKSENTEIFIKDIRKNIKDSL